MLFFARINLTTPLNETEWRLWKTLGQYSQTYSQPAVIHTGRYWSSAMLLDLGDRLDPNSYRTRSAVVNLYVLFSTINWTIYYHGVLLLLCLAYPLLKILLKNFNFWQSSKKFNLIESRRPRVKCEGYKEG